MEETSKKISCLINKSVTYGAKKYSNLLKQEFVKDRNFVASIKMLPNTTELMNLQAMMNNAVSSNPQLILYLDPFKAMRMAKENVALGELYFRQAQKRYIKTEQEKAQINSEQNAQSQQLSIKAKMEADTALTQQQALTKEKEIILQGVFDLAKANIPVPQELQGLVSDMLQNVTVPIVAQNKQQMAAMQAQQEMSQQQMQQGGEEQQLQEEQQMEMQQQ
jgi:hypothetical protein